MPVERPASRHPCKSWQLTGAGDGVGRSVGIAEVRRAGRRVVSGARALHAEDRGVSGRGAPPAAVAALTPGTAARRDDRRF